MKKLALALVLALAAVAAPFDGAQAVDAPTASASAISVSYDGSGCVHVPIILTVSGGVSNGSNSWITENETLAGPTSGPAPIHFFFHAEQTSATLMMAMCPASDHAGSYTFSADVWYNDSSSSPHYVGNVSARFTLGFARTKLARVSRHAWQVRIVGQPYLVSHPRMSLQKLKSGRWRTVRRMTGNSAGKARLKAAPAGRYRLVYAGDADRAFGGSTSKVFRRP